MTDTLRDQLAADVWAGHHLQNLLGSVDAMRIPGHPLRSRIRAHHGSREIRGRIATPDFRGCRGHPARGANASA